ncbi:sulfite exporter TauE/SafE family protein [Nitriliruptor alkaliphilus]|uniref:sulfite exporter TauE/SafE family protein n=1 Tax=Nitriliruptor alkaliphilus TaxID=427918 RepID=UPI0009FAB054|nr:sulfite exporter TauE/SafE family protein [Nitriliruptor alkaliphilus]
MALLDAALILLAAVGAGAMNAVVGAGTLITFPTLLALGFPPVVANVSNTVGLVPGSVAGAYAYRATLSGRAPLLRRLVVVSGIGGVLGGALLLALPPGAFELVVPPLLVLSGVLAAIQPRVAAWVVRRRAAAAPAIPAAESPPTATPALLHVSPLLLAGVAATGVYGGYFGAAQGVILLAILGVFVGGAMNDVNGIKNVLAGVANLVSAALFIAIADVDWSVAGLVAVGATIGGGLGGRYGRRLHPGPLRALVVTVAFVAAGWQLAT